MKKGKAGLAINLLSLVIVVFSLSLLNITFVEASAPSIISITYTPNLDSAIDPNTFITFNATIVDLSSQINTVVLEVFNQSNWNNYSMNLISGNANNGLWNSSFITSLNEVNYTLKVWANDSLGGSNSSNNITINSFWDCTWTATTSLSATAGYFENKTIGNIIVTNTGDSNYVDGCVLNFRSQHNLVSGIVYLNTAPKTLSYSLSPGQIKNISVNYSFGSEIKSDSIIISNNELLELTSVPQINTNAIAVTNYVGPYLYQTISDYPSTVYISPPTINFSAYLSNLNGLDLDENTAFNVTSSWIVNSLFTNLTGNLTRFFSNISNSNNNYLNLGLSLSNGTNLAAGIYSFILNSSGIDKNGNSILDRNNNSFFTNSVDIAFVCSSAADGFDAKACWPNDPDTIYCGNGHVDTGETCSTCPSDAGSCQTSGGGGSNPIISVSVITILDADLVAGFIQTMGSKDILKFNIANENHSITLKGLTAATVNLIIASDPINATLTVNQTQKFEINHDGYYDLRVVLNSIVNGKANLTIQGIHEQITKSITPLNNLNSSQNSTNNFENKNTFDSENTSILIPRLVISSIILILIVLGIIFLTFKIKKPSKK